MDKYIGAHSRTEKKEVYHTDKDCSMIKGPARPLTDNEVEYHNLTECSECDDDNSWRGQQTQDKSHYRKAVEYGKDDT